MARVGKAVLQASDVERRLAQLPEYQRRALSSSAAELPRVFTEQVLVPELLYSLEAEERGLARSATAEDKIRSVLSRALVEALRSEQHEQKPVTEAEIKVYYTEHPAQFERPRALRLWRILVTEQKLAQDILEQARGTDGVTRWSTLAREHSLDRATHERRGDLGFVRADGSTDVPTLRVDATLFAAADTVRDGELVPSPIALGEHFAVLWRRGSRAAEQTREAEAAPRIRRLLAEQRAEAALSALSAELVKSYVRDKDPSPLENLQLPPDSGL